MIAFPKTILGRAMSVFQLGSMVGAGSALIIAGGVYQFFLSGGGQGLPLIGAMRPWQQTFVAVALPGVVFLALLSFIREPRRPVQNIAVRTEPRGTMLRALKTDPLRYALLFLGMSGIIVTTYALLSWMPAILEREHGWSPATVGASYGLIVILASPGGLLLGGWISDLLTSRGKRGGHIIVALAAAGLALPLAMLIGIASQPLPLLALATVVHFLLSMPIGVIPAFLQLETLPEARGQVSALYILTVNVIGLGVGPTLVGLISSQWPSEPTGLRFAVTVVVVPFLVVASLLISVLFKKQQRLALD